MELGEAIAGGSDVDKLLIGKRFFERGGDHAPHGFGRIEQEQPVALLFRKRRRKASSPMRISLWKRLPARVPTI